MQSDPCQLVVHEHVLGPEQVPPFWQAFTHLKAEGLHNKYVRARLMLFHSSGRCWFKMKGTIGT